MNKVKWYKNDHPSKRKKKFRMRARKCNAHASQVLRGYWSPALNSRWKTRLKEIKRMWRRRLA